MPSGPRIRANNVYGTISDNPLLIGAVSFTSLGLSLLPAVAAQHAVLVFDPKRVFGEPEIVVVTAHLALGTTATITRGQYGTTARQHPQGTAWAHVPIGPDDYIAIVTSGTRPSNPYSGQFIFETDTNKLVGYGGTDWAPRDAGGQIGYAQVVAGQGSITTVTDLTGLSVAVTVGTNRRIRITGSGLVSRTVADGVYAGYIQEGATQLGRWAQHQPANAGDKREEASVVITPSAGSHTYKLTLERSTGTGSVALNAGATLPAFILVEDIGAA